MERGDKVRRTRLYVISSRVCVSMVVRIHVHQHEWCGSQRTVQSTNHQCHNFQILKSMSDEVFQILSSKVQRERQHFQLKRNTGAAGPPSPDLNRWCHQGSKQRSNRMVVSHCISVNKALLSAAMKILLNSRRNISEKRTQRICFLLNHMSNCLSVKHCPVWQTLFSHNTCCFSKAVFLQQRPINELSVHVRL